VIEIVALFDRYIPRRGFGMLDFFALGGRMAPLQHSSIARFGVYEFALPSADLRKSGLRIRVQQQPLKILELLLEHPGEVVSRDELKKRIWPTESFGDFDQAVNVAIAKLRTALGDSAENPRFIETIPRRGYRFIAAVTVDEVQSQPRPVPYISPSVPPNDSGIEQAKQQSPHPPRPWPHAPRPLAAASLVVFLLLVVWFAVLRKRPSPIAPATAAVRSLAVLPLDNLSNNSEDYFADGMTDELITDLAQIGDLRVISRTSVMPYKGIRKPLPQIARELNVDTVVEGTVLRSGQQVRITAQLIQATSDRHLWAQSYEGDVNSTLALQKRVARSIAEQIRMKLTAQEQASLAEVKEVSPEAYENYLRGRYFWNKRTADALVKAAFYFNEAIKSDPTYALPYTGLADINQLSDHPELARAQIKRALALDDNLAEAHNSLARLLYLFENDWIGAEKEFKRAIQLNHNYAPAHHWYSMYLAAAGRTQEAVAEAETAYELDPLSSVVGANLAKKLQEAGQDDQAILVAKRALDLAPDSGVTHAVLGIVYEHKGEYPHAINEYKRALQLGGPSAEIRGLLGAAYAASGNRNEAQRMISELTALWPEQTHAALDLAVVFSAMDDTDNTFYWLEKAHEKHVSDLIGIGQDPHFVRMRADPRFQALVQGTGMPR
jgi:TolB-like protein/DNA-binding winged helix-turn-helix (wHTH) protein/Flp pilus assembly protein TadD